jgi:hypothetical protein
MSSIDSHWRLKMKSPRRTARNLIIIVVSSVVAVVAGCSTPHQILKIRSLDEPVRSANSHTESNGDIVGIEAAAKHDGKIQANILYVHGIGWTQESRDSEFGHNFIRELRLAYGLDAEFTPMNNGCPSSTLSKKATKKSRAPANTPAPKATVETGLYVWDARAFREGEVATALTYGDAPSSPLLATAIGCIDKNVIDLGERGSINVYRILWDDLLYNAYQYPLLGYDDTPYVDDDRKVHLGLGAENIDGERRVFNSLLKNSIVTYGLSDAAMYMGPIGGQIRAAVRGGICAAIADATGQTADFAVLASNGKPRINKAVDEICGTPNDNKKVHFAIVSESLGSRVVFDVLNDTLRGEVAGQNPSEPTNKPALASWLNLVSNPTFEVFFFANQIPLLSAARLQKTPPSFKSIKKIKYVAISEINDALTYELVPYFEHLYFERCRNWTEQTKHLFEGCVSSAGTDKNERITSFLENRKIREAYRDALGYDVVDVRAQFAQPMFKVVRSFVNPAQAHLGHIESRPVRDMMLCGAKNGVPKTLEAKSCGSER